MPVWKWLEIKAAYIALLMLDFYLRGDELTWEQIWDSAGFSSEVNSWLDDLLSVNSTSGSRDVSTSAYAVTLQACFLHMAIISIAVQESWRPKQPPKLAPF